jgi:hypothetical protein
MWPGATRSGLIRPVQEVQQNQPLGQVPTAMGPTGTLKAALMPGGRWLVSRRAMLVDSDHRTITGRTKARIPGQVFVADGLRVWRGKMAQQVANAVLSHATANKACVLGGCMTGPCTHVRGTKLLRIHVPGYPLAICRWHRWQEPSSQPSRTAARAHERKSR